MHWRSQSRRRSDEPGTDASDGGVGVALPRLLRRYLDGR